VAPVNAVNAVNATNAVNAARAAAFVQTAGRPTTTQISET